MRGAVQKDELIKAREKSCLQRLIAPHPHRKVQQSAVHGRPLATSHDTPDGSEGEENLGMRLHR